MTLTSLMLPECLWSGCGSEYSEVVGDAFQQWQQQHGRRFAKGIFCFLKLKVFNSTPADADEMKQLPQLKTLMKPM